MTETELKPCPFCGKQPTSNPDYGHSSAWVIMCGNEGCDVYPDAWAITRDDAVAMWNTRPQEAGT